MFRQNIIITKDYSESTGWSPGSAAKGDSGKSLPVAAEVRGEDHDGNGVTFQALTQKSH